MATETDKVNIGALATLVAVGTFAMVGICLALVAFVREHVANEVSQKDVSADASFQSLKRAQLQKLETGVPIEKVMGDVVREYSANPRAATPPGAASAATPATTGGGGGEAATAAGGSTGGAQSAAALAGAGGVGGATAGSPSGDVELAPKPNRQKDGKLPPGDAAPAPAPQGASQPLEGAGSEHGH
jgi:hypothetical protein